MLPQLFFYFWAKRAGKVTLGVQHLVALLKEGVGLAWEREGQGQMASLTMG
jgi:hypothetical protein